MPINNPVIGPDLNTPNQPTNPVINPVVPVTPATPTISITDALKTLFGGANIQTLLLVGAIVWIGFSQFRNNPYPNPNPNPAPIPVPINPGQKTLKDLVGPDAATELANFYHGMSSVLFTDKARVGSKDDSPTLKNIGDFYQLQADAMQNFQNANNITGISAINEPISIKLRVATGSLDPGKSLDDPATKVRDSLIAACHQIAIEFDERYNSVPIGKFN